MELLEWTLVQLVEQRVESMEQRVSLEQEQLLQELLGEPLEEWALSRGTLPLQGTQIPRGPFLVALQERSAKRRMELLRERQCMVPQVHKLRLVRSLAQPHKAIRMRVPRRRSLAGSCFV